MNDYYKELLSMVKEYNESNKKTGERVELITKKWLGSTYKYELKYYKSKEDKDGILFKSSGADIKFRGLSDNMELFVNKSINLNRTNKEYYQDLLDVVKEYNDEHKNSKERIELITEEWLGSNYKYELKYYESESDKKGVLFNKTGQLLKLLRLSDNMKVSLNRMNGSNKSNKEHYQDLLDVVKEYNNEHKNSKERVELITKEWLGSNYKYELKYYESENDKKGVLFSKIGHQLKEHKLTNMKRISIHE